MKPFNFSSPYSRIGLFCAAAICAGALLIKGNQKTEQEVMIIHSDALQHDLPWKLVEPPRLNFEDFDPGAADIPNFRDPAASSLFGESKAPCYQTFHEPPPRQSRTLCGVHTDHCVESTEQNVFPALCPRAKEPTFFFFRTFHIGLHLTNLLVKNVHLFVPQLHIFNHF